MDRARIQKKIDEIQWYHEFDFGDGLKATTSSDVEGHRTIWSFIEKHLAAVDFRGKTVLDIGCWDGYWSFFAEKRGAKSVLAIDDFSQNWSSSRGIFLAKELLRSNIEIDPNLSVYDLPRLDRTFDVVLCLGVFYHLWDPFHAFAQIRQCCHPKTLVVMEGNVTYGLPPHSSLYDPAFRTSRFTPTCTSLEDMLTATYMRTDSLHLLHPKAEPTPAPPVPEPTERVGWRWRLQMAGAAMRGSRRGIREAAETLFPPAPPPQPVPPPKPDSRVLVMCTPIEGVNEVHAWKPPFGLHRFDPRFQSPAERTAA